MKFFFKLFISLLFFLFCSSLCAKEYKQEYLIEVGGLDIGKLYWEVFLNKDDYKINISLQNKGLVSGIYKFNGNYEAVGYIKDGVLFSSKYTQDWQTAKKSRFIEIFFENNKLTKLVLIPEEKEFARVQYMGIKSHFDPLSSFLNILLGNKISKTIDGRRIYSMVAENYIYNKNKESIKITIKDYANIWTDHKRNDLKNIEFVKNKNNEVFEAPLIIKIKFKQFVFKLRKI